jgi:hypothetical protein
MTPWNPVHYARVSAREAMLGYGFYGFYGFDGFDGFVQVGAELCDRPGGQRDDDPATALPGGSAMIDGQHPAR